MDIREQVLKVTEGKIDQKVSELKGLQSQLEELMKQYSQKENSKIPTGYFSDLNMNKFPYFNQ